MFKRHRLILVAIPLLSLAVACSAPGAPSVLESPVAEQEPQDIEIHDSDSQTPEDEGTTPSASLPAITPGSRVDPSIGTTHVWDYPTVAGDEVKSLLSVAAANDHVHFEVPFFGDMVEFVGYFIDETFIVRATVCPACGELAVDREGDVLLCGACGTVFDDVTGLSENGDPGYPEGHVPVTISGDTITMSLVDLQHAYTRTASGTETLTDQPDAAEQEADAVPLPPCCAR